MRASVGGRYASRVDAAIAAGEDTFAGWAQRYHERLYANVTGAIRRLSGVRADGDDVPAPLLDADDVFDTAARDAELTADLPGVLAPILDDVAVAVAAELAVGANAPEVVDLVAARRARMVETLEARVARLVSGRGVDGAPRFRGWNTAIHADLGAALRAGYEAGETVGQLTARVAGVLDVHGARKGPGARAEAIAITEVNGLANDTTAQAFEASGVVEAKAWYSISDARTRESHAEAAARYGMGGNPGPVPIGGRFVVGGVEMDRPHDPSAPAREVVRCRCRMLPVVVRRD